MLFFDGSFSDMTFGRVATSLRSVARGGTGKAVRPAVGDEQGLGDGRLLVDGHFAMQTLGGEGSCGFRCVFFVGGLS